MARNIKKIELALQLSQKIILEMLICVIVLFSCMYVYFSGSVVFKIVEKNNNLKNFQLINYEYQKTEESYFKLLNKIDLQYAQSLGFVEQKQGNFAVRPTTVVARR